MRDSQRGTIADRNVDFAPKPKAEIVILDPESSDPTWGPLNDALVIEVSQEDWDGLDTGEVSVENLIAKHRASL